MKEYIFFIVKVFTITLWGNTNKMPAYFDMTSNFSISGTDAQFVFIKYQAAKRSKWGNTDKVGRQHKTTTICDN
jgi:hypothetical protein